MLNVLQGPLLALIPLFASPPIAADPKTQAAPEKPKDDTAEKNKKFEAAKKACRMGGGKLANYLFCVDQAKDRIFNPPPPAPKKTPLEKELAHCEMMGKPVQVWQCKQDAPNRLEERRKEAERAAANAKKYTPLERALNVCRGYSKGIQIWQCTQEAKKKYGDNK